MENKQGTVIGLGCISIGLLCYFYKQYSDEAERYKAKKIELGQNCRKLQSLNYRLDYQAIKKANQPIFIPDITECTFKDERLHESYTKYIRHNLNNRSIPMDSFEQGQTGGSFTLTDHHNQHRKIIAEINNCNIDRLLFQPKSQKNITFLENKNKSTQSNSWKFTLAQGKKIAMYGIIGYSISEEKWIVHPEFLLTSQDAEEAISKMSGFWQEKLYMCTFKKIVMGISIVALGIVLICLPVKSMWMRWKNKLKDVSKSQFQHFLNKSYFEARKSSKLNCEICHAKTVSIIYQCGHLAICFDCNLQNLEKICPICKKVSRKEIKIFI